MRASILQLNLKHIKAAPRYAWASVSARWSDLRSKTFRSGRISSGIFPIEEHADVPSLDASTIALCKALPAPTDMHGEQVCILYRVLDVTFSEYHLD